MSQIVFRTDGVPLFLEELTKSVLESGIFRKRAGRLELRRKPFTLNFPKTLQGSLLERLDRLGPAKSVAQVAAVIGREFTYELLRLLVSMDPPALAAALDRLTASALVFGRGSPPHAVYTFKHALVRDAAYESLLKSERRRLHAELAIILQGRASSRIHHHPDVLADHYAKSGQTNEAIKHWAIAARQALQRAENVEALGYASKALDVINLLPDTPERRDHELGIKLLAGGAHWLVSGFASSEVENTFIRAQELATQVGDAARLTLALRGLSVCYYTRGELIRACTAAEKIILLAQEGSNSADLMWGRMMLGSILFWQGEFARARRELEASLVLYDPIDQSAKTISSQIDPGIAARCHLGWTLWIIGCPDQAQEFSDQTVAQARRIDQPSSQAMALFWSAVVQFYRGDIAAATATTKELRAITTEFRLAYYGLRASLLEGAMMVATGQFERGLPILRQTIFELQTQKTGLALPWAYSLAAMGCLGLGMSDDALAMLQKGTIAVQAGKQCHWEAELYRLKGEVLSLLSTGEAVAAEACLVQAIDLARDQGARSLELRAAVSYGRMLQRRGDYRKAQESVTQVLSAFSEGFATTDIVDAKGVSAELRGVTDRP
jgi:tetratricopeptide (TPR) repeat protein